jgi:hypothetical protein
MNQAVRDVMTKRIGLCAMGLWLAGTLGCGATLSRVSQPEQLQAQLPPTIERTQDLGGLPLPSLGRFSTAQSDGLYTPGEWIALHGKHLTAATRVTIGGQPAQVLGFLEGGALLARMPRGVVPGPQTLSVDNGVGSAQVTIPTAIYAFGGDAQGDSVRIRRLSGKPDAEAALDQESFDVAFPLARFVALSPDGGTLFVLQELTGELEPTDSSSAVSAASVQPGVALQVSELLSIHLGAKGGPRVVMRVPLALQGKPTAMKVGPFGQLVVLQARQLTVIETSGPGLIRPLAQLPLASPQEERALIDAEFIGDGQLLTVLEAYTNQLHLIDLHQPSLPQLVGGVALSQAYDQPFSIDLAPGDDAESVWVLQGPNFRLAGKRLTDGLGGVWRDAKALDVRAAGKTLGQTAVGAAMLPSESLTRLEQVRLTGGALTVVKSLPLPPEVFPFFVQPDHRGSLFVSGINRKNQFTDLEASLDGVRRVLGALKDTVQLGVVLKVGTETGVVTTALQGVAIYYDLALLPSGELLTSTVRLGAGYIPPRVTLDWGLEVPGRSFAKLREVANTALKITDAVQRLLPPYRYERIGVQ